MKIKLFISAVVLSMVVFSGLAYGEPKQWDLDKDHAGVYFDIRHVFSTIRGLFDDFSGTVYFDPDNKETGSVEFTVKVASINTNIAKRDTHLRSDDFFSAKTYPEMRFKSTALKPVTDDKYILEGDLTIKDVTKRISVPFTFLGMRENPGKPGTLVAGFEASFSIDRLEYHVGSGKFHEMGLIGKDVHIVVSLEVVTDT